MQDEQDQQYEIINNIGVDYYNSIINNNNNNNNNVIVIHDVPLNYEQHYIYNEILNQVEHPTPPPIEKKKRVSKTKSSQVRTDVHVPKFSEHDSFMQNEHKVAELKEICKHYGIKCSGTKQELKQRIHTFLIQSHFIPRIQRLVRRNFYKMHARVSGPAYYDRSLCVNDTDFYSMEPVRDISQRQFISVKDDAGMVYGFDIMSLHTYYMSEIKNGNISSMTPITNPYNRMPLPLSLRRQMMRKIFLTHIIGSKCMTEVEPEPVLSIQQQDENTLFAAFQQINSHGHYADSAWFSELHFVQIMRFMRELADIWNYRAQILPHLKQEICPPNGDPFRYIDLRGFHLQPELIRHHGIQLVKTFVTSGINRDSQSLGAYYVLSALTLVSQPAQAAMPWLYESVVHA
jgi:hypothetical protein